QDFVVGCSFTVDDSIEFEIDPDNRVIVEEGVVCSVSENMLPKEISLSAYPNPFNSCVNITTDALEIAIMNVQGKDVYRGKVENSEFSWNPQDLTSGLYIVKAIGEKEKSIRISYIK
ncbi:MAG: T9SS type A sorting domain-containing protein, partial [Candidatus Thorarchaeota archaeon]